MENRLNRMDELLEKEPIDTTKEHMDWKEEVEGGKEQKWRKLQLWA